MPPPTRTSWPSPTTTSPTSWRFAVALARSINAYQQALALKRRHGLEASEAMSLNGLGIVYFQQGRLDLAEQTLSQAEQLARANGGQLLASYAVSNLGDVWRERGDMERAVSLYRRSLREKEALGSRYALAYTWNSLAELYRQTGDLEQARAFSARALALRSDEAGPIEYQRYRVQAGRIALTAGDYALLRAQLEPATAELRRLGCEHVALRAAWWLGAARWRSDGQIDPTLLASLTSAEQAADQPLLGPLVREAPDLAVALWVNGTRAPGFMDGLLEHHGAVQDEIERKLSGSTASEGAAEALLDVAGGAARL